MAFDLNNFVINRPLRGAMFHSTTGEMLWSINQVVDPTLTVSSETQNAVDALGMPIMQFNRGKNAEFGGSNSLFDLGLLAAQSGTTKTSSTASVTYAVPIWEEFTVPSSGTTVTLAQTPNASGADGIPYIYLQNNDGTVATKHAYAASADATKFTFSSKTLTFPTGFTAGQKFLVYYEYEANGTEGSQAVKVTNTALNFPSAGKFVLEVLGSNVCDISTEYHGYIVFPAAKLSSDFDITFNTEGTHPFTITAFQEYCDSAKTLFYIVVPEA
jgi:hypothetical protein